MNERLSGTLILKTQATVPGIPVCGTATYVWQELEPMAVLMTVHLPCQEGITWHFTRDMLDEAFTTTGQFAGEGDVQVKADVKPRRLHYWLAADGGLRHSIYTLLDPVQEWLLETYKVVGPDAETADVDTALAQLLGEAS